MSLDETKQKSLDKTQKKEEYTLSKITVIRGKYDDCIGIQKEYS